MGPEFDLAIVGGGLAGSALGLSLAKHGRRVLILEREAGFRDRVRGEGMHPWGVVEAQRLSILNGEAQRCTRELPYWTRHAGGAADRRDLRSVAPGANGCLAFHHPLMQEQLLQAAADAGALVWRPSQVLHVTPGRIPGLVVKADGREYNVSARLVVGADGRASRTRAWGKFRIRTDPELLRITGALHLDIDLPADSVHVTEHAESGRKVLYFPIGERRFRSYYVSRCRDGRPLSGDRDGDSFLEACVAAGTPACWLKHAKLAGPLASFDVADRWVDHPYCNGVVLVGDSAAASDPSFGCGLSLTFRDVRVLRDHLVANDDWDAAADAYAVEHDRYFGSLHRILSWYRELNYADGSEADTRRARVRPLLYEQPQRRPDFVAFGPEAPSDEPARQRFFGEA